ncbi:MAG TPA: hypothetical protein VHO67_05455 [Polyangia bacterium]|nr:hypothetical protein [Polyangia bacterium]
MALAVAAALVAGMRRPALAETSTADRAIAERLYDQGKGQIEQGQVAAACDSFAESQRLDPGTGTLLNLAACHETQGKLASAWVEFREALAAARREKRPDRVRYAQDHLKAIEPRLAYVTIAVAESVDGQAPVVTLDGRALGPAVWGIAIPVDAGWHEAVATFGPDRSWRATVNVRDGQRRTLQVPARSAVSAPPIAQRPEPAVVPPLPAATAPPSDEAASAAADRPGHRVAALIIGAAGLAAVGVGSYYAWSASDLWSQRNRECPMERCTAAGVSFGGRAESAATVATWTIGGGLAALGVTALLLFWPRAVSGPERASAPAPTRPLAGIHFTAAAPFGVGGTF